MTSLQKRERILVSAVIVTAVLCGLYYMTGALNVKHSLADEKALNAELQAFAGETAAGLSRTVPSAFDIYVGSRAESNWGRNPFSGKIGVVKDTTGNALQQPSFMYTGYIEAGSRKVAIIDNIEYLAGDPMEKQGFFVKKISPEKVVIEDRSGKREFEVPLSE